MVVEPAQNKDYPGSVRVYFEVQNLLDDPLSVKQIYFSDVPCFQWQLTDQDGKPVPHSETTMAASFAWMEYPIILPSGSTLRIPVAFGTYQIFKPFLHSLPTDPGTLGFLLSHNVPWQITGGKMATYYLSAVFTGATDEPKDFHAVPRMPALRSWKGTLFLPKVILPPRPD